ncbi:hypothetical protein GOBAR_AA31165 [Gossypium barbadense]|uniref:Uncharacterized protein n=1 Tax=Gossypium barbadense TaxID=3634 RepID=A0A2P5WEK9_GOSBA|nr:hypothetical protein GOBAR_AA31165 [Gossypium barbadense]
MAANERSLALPNAASGDDANPSSDMDRNTKKVRFKDRLDNASSDIIVDSVQYLTLSWKDKLMGGILASFEIGSSASTFGVDSNNNKDLDLLVDDVQTSIVNGVLAIIFFDRIKEILYKEMELTVVIKLLGQNIGYNTLHNRISTLWKPISQFHLIDIENGYYLGPWIIFGQYLTVQLWSKEFSPLPPYPNVVLAWIRLPGLPGFMFHRQIVEAIGGLIGKVVKLDFQTDKRTRVSQSLVDRVIQWVEYEALPTICFGCGKYDHVKDLCPTVDLEPTSGDFLETTREALDFSGGEVVEETRSELGLGCWMRDGLLGTTGDWKYPFYGAKRAGRDVQKSRWRASVNGRIWNKIGAIKNVNIRDGGQILRIVGSRLMSDPTTKPNIGDGQSNSVRTSVNNRTGAGRFSGRPGKEMDTNFLSGEVVLEKRPMMEMCVRLSKILGAPLSPFLKMFWIPRNTLQLLLKTLLIKKKKVDWPILPVEILAKEFLGPERNLEVKNSFDVMVKKLPVLCMVGEVGLKLPAILEYL